MQLADYQLLDFGQGRKLERWGPWVLDRPAPAAMNVPAEPGLWANGIRYDRDSKQSGAWHPSGVLPGQWPISLGQLTLELRPTEFGHLGIFPEQFPQWQWIAEQVREAASPPTLLNLFAYTGVSSLVAAASGAAVTHVDAARNVVQWARHNAELSGLADRPIRWIAEDALKFVRREVRRGRRYDALVLDPPSYGHGPSGEAWKLEQHLPELLALCRELLGDTPRFVLLTGHTVGWDAGNLQESLQAAGFRGGRFERGEMTLVSKAGPSLAAGHFVRWLASSS